MKSFYLAFLTVFFLILSLYLAIFVTFCVCISIVFVLFCSLDCTHMWNSEENKLKFRNKSMNCEMKSSNYFRSLFHGRNTFPWQIVLFPIELMKTDL